MFLQPPSPPPAFLLDFFCLEKKGNVETIWRNWIVLHGFMVWFVWPKTCRNTWTQPLYRKKKVREEWNENKKEDEKNRRWRKKGTGNRLLFWLPMNGFYCWIKRLLTMAISQIFWFFIWLKWRQGLFIIGDGPIHDAGELFAFYSITWIEPAMNQCLTRLGEWLN